MAIWRLHNKSNTEVGYTLLPQVYHQIDTVSLSSLVTRIGGFWTSISKLTFIVASLFLMQKMFESQATQICQRQENSIPNRADLKDKA